MPITISPRVHLNGTSKQALIAQYQHASHKIREAVMAVAAAGPHPRDYYVIGGQAFEQARDDQLQRLQKLQEVMADMSQLALNCYQQEG